MTPEVWRPIPDFPRYSVSDYGNVFDHDREALMATSQNNHGHTRVAMWHPDGNRYTRSVAPLVAREFVYVPDRRCDHVIVLNGDLSNVAAWNLAWRPLGFAWEYTHQLKQQQPRQFQNLEVLNITDGIKYPSVVHAGVAEGRLFKDIWRSCNSGDAIYPYGCVFKVTTRV